MVNVRRLRSFAEVAIGEGPVCCHVVGSVFLLVDPQYAGKALWPRLQAILRCELRLLRPTDDLNERRLQEINWDAALELTQLMGIADDARWRGSTARCRPELSHRVVGQAAAHREPAQPDRQRAVSMPVGCRGGDLQFPGKSAPGSFPPRIAIAQRCCDDMLLHNAPNKVRLGN